MSTNYYARTPLAPDGEDGLHIGQHIAGWQFLFRAHPERGLTDCAAWRTFLSQPDVDIVSETGRITPLEDFWPGATQRPADTPHRLRSRFIGDHRRPGESEDDHGHPFQATEFC